MKRRKSSSPSTVPWGTPLSTGAFSDVAPSTMTCCVRCLTLGPETMLAVCQYSMFLKVCHYTAGDDVLLQLKTYARQRYWPLVNSLEPVSFF